MMIMMAKWYSGTLGLKFPDICLTSEEKPQKKPHPGNLSRPGIEPGPRCVLGAHATAWPTAVDRNDLVKRKILSRFVSHKLTDEQKAKRMETSGDFISMCDQEPLLLENIVTGDETWCYQFDPESKRQSMAWCSSTFPRPRKSRLQKSKVKMLLIFFDNKGSSIAYGICSCRSNH